MTLPDLGDVSDSVTNGRFFWYFDIFNLFLKIGHLLLHLTLVSAETSNLFFPVQLVLIFHSDIFLLIAVDILDQLQCFSYFIVLLLFLTAVSVYLLFKLLKKYSQRVTALGIS